MTDIGTEYDHAYIVANPIDTRCVRCKRREPINAPSLANVRCFWCGAGLQPMDRVAYDDRLKNLWKHAVVGQQSSLFGAVLA